MRYHGNFKLIRMSCWRNSGSVLAYMAMPNVWFREIGLLHMDVVDVGIIVSA